MNLIFLFVNATIQTSEPETVQLVYATWALVFTTMGLALITWYSTRSSLLTTKHHLQETIKSNELFVMELKEKYKPRIQIHNGSIQYESSETNFANFTCLIVNSGKVTLREIKIAYEISIRKMTLKELLKDEKEIWKNVKSYDTALNPETRLTDYTIRFHEDNKNEIWVKMWFKFQYLQNSFGEEIFQLRFKELQNVGFDLYTNEQID
ncbi:MAG: hypothetical protein EB161_01105, partial [Nitrosopumilaceae archaeon]|nr:hypothetical protein [Nitrosopumilaceae archaeon]